MQRAIFVVSSGIADIYSYVAEGVIMELGWISFGFNLYKYHLKMVATQKAA